jgi:hypothetical protein
MVTVKLLFQIWILKLDRTKLKEYHFDTRFTYNKEIYTRKQAMNLFDNLVRR